MTALLDALGRTIDELGDRLAQLPERDCPTQVIVPILTDGLETAAQISIASTNAATYVADEAGSRASYRTFSREVRAQEHLDAAADLSVILKEEDHKEREK